jgi:hypothetical protein
MFRLPVEIYSIDRNVDIQGTVIGTYSKVSIQVLFSTFVRAFILIVHITDMDDKVIWEGNG